MTQNKRFRGYNPWKDAAPESETTTIHINFVGALCVRLRNEASRHRCTIAMVIKECVQRSLTAIEKEPWPPKKTEPT